MFAIMILGVGLIAVASLFPVATAVQRKTVNEVLAQQVARNYKALIAERKITVTAAQVTNYSSVARYAYVDADGNAAGDGATATTQWTAELLSYPSLSTENYDGDTENAPDGDLNGDGVFDAEDIKLRPYFVTILARKDSTNGWKVFALIQRRLSDTIPQVVNAGNVNLGDLYIEPDGDVGVRGSDGTTTHWHGELDGNQRTALQIVVLGEDAVIEEAP